LILSGQDDEAMAIKAVHQGVQDYLVKGDITSKQLGRALSYAVEGKGCCVLWKSHASSNSNSRISFCHTFRTNYGHR